MDIYTAEEIHSALEVRFLSGFLLHVIGGLCADEAERLTWLLFRPLSLTLSFFLTLFLSDSFTAVIHPSIHTYIHTYN